MTLQEAKDQVAKKKGYNSFAYVDDRDLISDILEEAAELYAQSERARVWDEAIALFIEKNILGISYYENPYNPYKS